MIIANFYRIKTTPRYRSRSFDRSSTAQSDKYINKFQIYKTT